MRRSKSIAILVIILFLFQFSAPFVQTGTAHTSKECEKLKKKWKNKVEKALRKNQALQDLLKGGGAVAAGVKGGLKGAAVGMAGGAAAGLVFGGIGAGPLAGKAAVAVGVGGAVNGFLDHLEKIQEAREAYNKAKQAAEEARKAYEECMKKIHPDGVFIPYMDSPQNIQYGETHDALFQANVAFNSVYFYVKSPDQTGYGTLVSTVEGDGATMSATFSFTAPQTTGTYTLTAYAYFPTTIVESSYDVVVFLAP